MSKDDLLDYYKNNYFLQPFVPQTQTIMADDPIGWWAEAGTVLKYQYNPIYNYVSNIGKYEKDDNFHPEDHINFLAEDPSYLMGAESLEELTDMRKHYANQMEIKKDMEQVRWHAALAGGIADPLTWMIPAGVFFKGAKTVWGGVKAGLMSGGAYGVSSELLRAPFDPTNTALETGVNLGTMTAFGGAVGGVMRVPHAIKNMKSGNKKTARIIEDVKKSILTHKQPKFNLPFSKITLRNESMDVKDGTLIPKINNIPLGLGATKAKTSTGKSSESFYKDHNDSNLALEFKDNQHRIKVATANIMDTKRKITLQESKVIPKKVSKKVKLEKQAVIDKLKGVKRQQESILRNEKIDRNAIEAEIRRRQSPYRNRPKYKNWYIHEEVVDKQLGTTKKTLYIDIKRIREQWAEKPWTKIKNLIDLGEQGIVKVFGKKFNVGLVQTSDAAIKRKKGLEKSNWAGLHVYRRGGNKAGIIYIDKKTVSGWYNRVARHKGSKRRIEFLTQKINKVLSRLARQIGTDKEYIAYAHELFVLKNIKQFTSKSDFFDFITLHELNHGKYKQRKGETGVQYEQRIDELALKDFIEFKKQGITGGQKVAGIKELTDKLFETPDDWVRFNYHKIIDEIDNPRDVKFASDTRQVYEDWINKRAVGKLERFKMKHGPAKQYNVSELDGSNRVFDLMSTPLKSILKFIGGKGQDLPDHIKGYAVRLASDAGLIINQNIAGRTSSSVLLSMQRHWEFLGDAIYKIQDLHFQQSQGLSKFNPDIKTKRNILLGYRGGKSFQDFLHKATMNYIMRSNEKAKKSNPNLPAYLKDINWTKKEQAEAFGAENTLTEFEERASDVMEDFFKKYETQANEAGLFSIDRSIEESEFWINNILAERLDRMNKRADNLFIDLNKSRGRTKASQQFRKDIKNELDELNDSIRTVELARDGHQKRLDKLRETKAKNFKPVSEDSYYSRIFDKTYITKHRERFTRLIEAWFKAKPYRIIFDNETGVAKRKNYSANPKDIRARADKFVSKILDEEDLDELDSHLVPLSTGYLNPRTLDAPNYWSIKDFSTNDTIRLTEFIVTDPLEVMRSYTLRIAPKIEFKKEFNLPFHKIMDEVDEEMHAEGFTPKEISDVKGNFATLYERIVGQRIKNPMRWDNRIANTMRWLSQITYLGDAGRAALADMPNTFFQHGVRPFQVVMEHMSDIPSMIKASKSNRIAGEGLLEILKGMISNRLVDSMMMNPASRGFTKFKERSLNAFYNLNLLRPLTIMFKEAVGLFAQDDIIRNCIKWNTLDDAKKIEMSRYFIGEKEAKIIANMNYEMNTNKTLYIANVDNWANEEGKRIMSRAMASRMNTAVLTATASDKFQLVDGVVYVPFKRWMFKLGWKPDGIVSTKNNPVLRLESGLMGLPFQFWNYGLAAQQKILNAGFDPTRPITQRIFGIAMMVGMGYTIARWRLPDNMWDKMSYDERLMRAVHLSGVTGMYSDFTFMASAMYHGFSGADREKSFVKPLYQPDFFDSAMEPFGASIGMVGDISKGTYTMATDSVAHGIAEMPLPLQYIPFWREDVRQMKMKLRNTN